MAGGLFALLDDVVALARYAAASLDDIGAGAAKAAAKSAGVIIDDAAVSPQYVQGVSAARELGVVKRIAAGSMKNKFFFIIPGAMLLSVFLPAALPVLLICGGLYLAFEGAEKALSWVGFHHESHDDAVGVGESDEETENRLVSGAVRTDLVLSTEIMLISLSYIEADNWWTTLGTLALVAVLMTVAVYGAVALLVRMDDFGIKLTESDNKTVVRIGRGIVKSMPKTFSTIAVIGTIAMLWVGGHLLLANPAELGFSAPYDLIHDWTHSLSGVILWVADTALSAVYGLIAGLVVVGVVLGANKVRGRSH